MTKVIQIKKKKENNKIDFLIHKMKLLIKK